VGLQADCLIALFGAPEDGPDGVRASVGALLIAETMAIFRKANTRG